MKILLVNWQDRENPQSGGAEIHLHEIFGRLAARGHEVSMLCGGWPGASETATIDGIRVRRAGTRYTFPLVARRAHDRHFAGAYDILVEDINKIPLFTRSWVGRAKSIALVPHLFGATVFQEAPLPLASVVWLAERPIPSRYAGVPFEAISESTADDLVARGVPRDSIRVIYPGIDTAYFTPQVGTRSPTPTFAYLGRLKRYKGVDLVIRSFARAALTDAVLEIAGAGDHRPALERLAESLDLSGKVTFLGRISEVEKLELLRRSWALAFASPKEGWGITNLEAAACGTPVIASNSPGLRESVRDGETGYLVPHGDIDAMAEAFHRLATQPRLVASLGERALAFAATFSWDRTARETEQHLQDVLERGG